jgi:hypothetical protein
MVYAALFGIGELCFGRYAIGAALCAVAVISAALLYGRIARMAPEPEVSAAASSSAVPLGEGASR